MKRPNDEALYGYVRASVATLEFGKFGDFS
jgi:hypothetical protein